jgi:hypothetical protein
VTALLTPRAAAASGSHPAVTFVVTIFMSTQDEAGDIYPRIEFAQDNFGHSIDPFIVEPDGRGGFAHTGQIVSEGDVLTFTLRGSDPQNRDDEVAKPRLGNSASRWPQCDRPPSA